MKLLAKISHRLHTAARYIENPQLLALHRRGVDTDLFQKFNQPWFHALGIKTVLDIGANVGRSAVTYKALLPRAHVYSFEPLPDCFKQLRRRMKGVENFTGFNIGIGDESGQLEFKRSSFPEASSFLPMTNVHKEAWPQTRDIKVVSVRMERLDDMAEKLAIVAPFLVKIDVQGYEDRVLRGGEQTIRKAQLVILETSYVRLYEEQPLFDDIYHMLTDWEFTYAGATGHIINPTNGHPLAEDSIFVRRD